MTVGKSVHDSIVINNQKTISYAECCQRYLKDVSLVNELRVICLKCSRNLQRVHSLHLDADELAEKLRRTCHKTKRLHRIRQLRSTDEPSVEVKVEASTSEHVRASPGDADCCTNRVPVQSSTLIPSINSAFIPPRLAPSEHECPRPCRYQQPVNPPSPVSG